MTPPRPRRARARAGALPGSPAPDPVWVDAVDAAGSVVGSVAVGHGEHPESALRRVGWAVADLLGAGLRPSGRGITLRYAVHRAPMPSAQSSSRAGPTGAGSARAGLPRDRDLVLEPGERPVRVQRVAAYALVRSTRGVLLTQLSARTNAPGLWSLPGGGLEPGEPPETGLHREVREETGQRLEVRRLLGVIDGHWVGRAPRGRAEDFHAVRLLYQADCPAPTDPVVHEVDGTTAAAAWVSPAAIPALAISATWRDVLTQWAAG